MTDDLDHDGLCIKCNESVSLRDGCDSTGYCDDCAQNIALAAKHFVETHKPDYDEVKDSNSASNDPEFLLLCEAVLPEDDL